MNKIDKYFEEISNNKKLTKDSDTIQKINKLYEVGCCTANKLLGTHMNVKLWSGIDKRQWSKVRNYDSYFKPDALEWFKFWDHENINIVHVDADNEYIYFTSDLFSKDRNARYLRFPIVLLSLSDRDFAKMIRQSINSHKKWTKYYKSFSAKQTIQENKQKILKLKEENRELEKISDKETTQRVYQEFLNQNEILYRTMNKILKY